MSQSKRSRFLPARWFSAIASFAVLLGLMAVPANSCPFCSAVARTFTEQMDSSDLVVIACLLSEPEGKDRTQLPRADFKVSNVLKGKGIMTVGQEFRAVVVSRRIKIGDSFLVMGNGTDSINWTTPQLVSETVISYLQELEGLPEKGGDRLEFFAKYFEHEETMLAYDAYDEFARAPYDEIKELKGRLDPNRLLGWLKDPEVMRSRKRLYYTLLGVVGGEEQLPFLEEVIASGDRDRQSGLDALLACYLTLKGDDGVELIEETFLKHPESEYVDVFSAISALRFHGTEADKVSKPRIVEALRYVLNRPKMADMVIPDLARWEDWSVMDRLVQMFKDSNTDETRWVRTPIISYLQACPMDVAKDHIAVLREIDPNAAKRADMLAELDWGDDDDDEEDSDPTSEPKVDEQPQPTPEVTEADESSSKSETTTGNGKTANEEAGTEEESNSENQSESENGGQGSDQQENAETDDSNIYDDGAPAAVDSELGVVANSPVSTFVGTIDPTASVSSAVAGNPDEDLPESGESKNEQLAQRTNPAPPAAMIASNVPATGFILLAGLGICAILFVLLWSVLNGTFERLIS